VLYPNRQELGVCAFFLRASRSSIGSSSASVPTINSRSIRMATIPGSVASLWRRVLASNAWGVFLDSVRWPKDCQEQGLNLQNL